MRFVAQLDFAPTLSANLLRFLDRVQQLLVRVIFLPGISDSNKPISRITLRWANHLTAAERPFGKNWVKQKRQPFLFHRQALGRRFASSDYPFDNAMECRGTHSDAFVGSMPRSYLPTDRLLRRIRCRSHWAERLTLLGRDTILTRYSFQE